MTAIIPTGVCASTVRLSSFDVWRGAEPGGKQVDVRRRLIMKKLVLAAVLSAFSFSAAATYACDGMKGHEKSEKSDTQAKKDAKKDSSKSDQKS
jgi:hypothetical protein